MDELERTTEELEEALHTIDDMIDRIGTIIIDIAANNDDFICSCCLKMAEDLYQIIKEYAREEDCADTLEQFAVITGRNLDD